MKKIKFNILSIILTSLIGLSTSVSAMSYAVNKNFNGYNLIYASGHIRHGDLYALKRRFNSLPHNKQTIVVFNSNGGELQEGLKIGRFLKRNRIGSAVRANGICASACAMAFLGGRAKDGSKLMILPYSARLGFHSFYYKNGSYVKLRKVQKDISKVLNYASYVGAPNYLIAKMFNTNSNHMYFIGSKDRYALGIKSGLPRLNIGLSAYVTKSNNGFGAKNYIIKYLKSYNNFIASSSGGLYYSRNCALNSSGYQTWLSQNLKYIHLANIKQIAYNKVEAKVIYSLKNGRRVCSINNYLLKKEYGNNWKILRKQHTPCSRKNSKILRKIAKALP